MAISNNNLKLFVEVCNNNNNITKTSEKLYISQPAISKAIKSIENELNVNLYYRSKKDGLTLTPIGEKLLYQARKILFEGEYMYNLAKKENNIISGELKIASIPLFRYSKIAECIKIFTDKYPKIHIEYTDVTTAKVKEMVKNYQADIGITIYPFDSFITENIYKDRMVLVSTVNLNIEKYNLLTNTSKIMLCQSALDVIEPVLRKNNNFNPQVYQPFSSPHTVKVFVEQGLGFGILSESFIKDSDLYKYSLEPNINSDVKIIYNNREELSHSAIAFLKEFRQMQN